MHRALAGLIRVTCFIHVFTSVFSKVSEKTFSLGIQKISWALGKMLLPFVCVQVLDSILVSNKEKIDLLAWDFLS